MTAPPPPLHVVYTDNGSATATGRSRRKTHTDGQRKKGSGGRVAKTDGSEASSRDGPRILCSDVPQTQAKFRRGRVSGFGQLKAVLRGQYLSLAD